MRLISKFLFFIFIFGIVCTAPINQSKINKVLSKLIEEYAEESDYQIRSIDLIEEEGYSLFYIYHLDPHGFVIISADDRAFPVLGYSFQNNFRLEGMPENINWLLNNYKDQILYLINSNAIQNNNVRTDWEYYLSQQSNNSEIRNVNPLLDAEFDQSGAWNNALSDFNFYGPVGCVAVSMSQIMHYWGYPEQGEGSNSYFEEDYGTLEANFETAFYDFDNMAATYATAPSQLLLYHTGISVNMDYENSGSGASVEGVYPSAEYALENFFKYNDDIYVQYKENYTTTEFRNILKNELNYNRPILYSGYTDSNYNGGHAWNIDGYQGNNMHCNWGWGGYNNGYFNLTSMGGFSSYQSALINIVPDPYLSPLALYEFEVDDMTAIFIDLSEFVNESEIETWNWNYGDGITETNSNGYAEHTYNSSGDYEVTLTVTNIYGQTGEPHIEFITIGNLMLGDINEDTILNILDIVMMVNFVLGSDNPTNSELNASDMNEDEILNVLDIVILLNLILN